MRNALNLDFKNDSKNCLKDVLYPNLDISSHKNNPDSLTSELCDPVNVENDLAERHNKTHDRISGSVIYCSVEKKDDFGSKFKLNGTCGENDGFSRLYGKRQSGEIHIIIDQLVKEYPLKSDLELFLIAKEAGLQSGIKLNKVGFKYALSRLELSSGYERFRHYVKG